MSDSVRIRSLKRAILPMHPQDSAGIALLQLSVPLRIFKFLYDSVDNAPLAIVTNPLTSLGVLLGTSISLRVKDVYASSK